MGTSEYFLNFFSDSEPHFTIYNVYRELLILCIRSIFALSPGEYCALLFGY